MYTFYEYVTTIILHLKQDNVTRPVSPRSTAAMHSPVSLGISFPQRLYPSEYIHHRDIGKAAWEHGSSTALVHQKNFCGLYGGHHAGSVYHIKLCHKHPQQHDCQDTQHNLQHRAYNR